MLRRRRRRMHQDGIQPFLPADVNDPMVRESAEFVMKRLPLEPVSYTGFDVSGKNSYKISIAKVESQVTAGYNFRLTLVIRQDHHCVGAFDVEVYDHWGDTFLTSWGKEHTCDEAHQIHREFKQARLQWVAHHVAEHGEHSEDESEDEHNAS